MTRGPSKQFDTDTALAKAMEVFWAHGYEATSLSELLKNMRIGKKSLYDTFGNKRSLFLKTLEYYANILIKDMQERLLAEGSPLENLEALLRHWQVMHSQLGSHGCMFGTNIADFSTDDKEVSKVMRAYLQEMEDTFMATLTRAQKVGELKPEANIRNLARLLLCTAQGMALLGRVMESDTVLEGTVTAAITALEQS